MDEVLLIGPNTANDEAVVRLLEREQWKVSCATNKLAGLDAARTAQPAIVIADDPVGGCDGLELLREVRALVPACEVILVTDVADIEVAIEALRAGALDYLHRPIDHELLRVALGRARERRPHRARVELPVILLMEDYEPTLRQLARVLETEGFLVYAAPNGEDGMRIFEQHRVDVILADLAMPRKDGLTVLREVKAREPDVEVIVVTGGGNEDAVVEALRQGAINFLKKPVDIEQMLLAIQKALDFQTVRRSLAYRNRDTQIMQELVVRLTRELELVVETPSRISGRTLDFAQQLVDFLPIGIVVADRSCEVQFANRHIVEKVGRQPRRLSAEWLHLVGIHNVTDQQLEAALSRTSDLKPGSIETLMVSRWAFLVMTPLKLVRTGATDQLVVVAIRGERGGAAAAKSPGESPSQPPGPRRGQFADAEEELNLKDAAMAASLSGVAITSLDGRLRYVNDTYLRVFDLELEEVLGQRVSDLFPDGQPMVEDVARTGSFVGEIEHRRRDGNIVHGQISVSLVRNSSGIPVATVATIADISSLKRVEQELRLKNAAMEASLGAILIGGMDGRVQYVNDAYVRLSGYARDELVGHQAMELFPDGQPIVEAVLRDGSFVGQVDHRCKDGSVAHVQLSVNLIRDANGMPVASVSTMSDITSLKRTQEELRLKEAAIAIAANGIAMVDLDGRFSYVNDAFVRLSGYDREELVGSPVTSSLGQSATPTLETLLRDGHASGEEALRRKDGVVIPIHATSTVIPDETGCPVALMISFVDLTEIRRAEEELRLRDAAMAASLSAILVGDLDGRIRYVNDAYIRMFGYAREEVVGRLPTDLFPEGRVAVEGLRRDGRFVGEIEHRHKNGETVHAQIAVNVIRDASGAPVASVSTMADVTALRHAEQDLARRTRELERSNRELEQFAYVASHDLQEPLRMVSSYTQLLAKRYQDRLDNDANEFIAYAVGGANRMQRLINDLLAYSRVNTQGKVPKLVDSHVALGHALANLATAIEEQQAMVSNDDMPVVNADETQLVQVFQNLIGNALKFCSGQAPRIHVSAEHRPGEWLFSVQDNGIGIASEFHPRLFQIFQRLHGKDVPGTGIGLALCKRIIERHGGIIWVESEEGQGATFRFTLPG